MIDILASAIILSGNQCGVWSSSHPDLYPEQNTECIVTVEETDDDEG